MSDQSTPVVASARRTDRRVAAVLLMFSVITAGCVGSAASTADGEGSGLVAEGQQLYGASCAGCHGVDLTGTGNGPPLLDPIYAPDHHPDGAFYAAVEFGVQPHHWEFGPMPRLSLDEEKIRRIVAYVRSVQSAEGIAP